nr:glycoside hydrolase family 88 protein [uncultured Carboxylicivirga sp.]
MKRNALLVLILLLTLTPFTHELSAQKKKSKTTEINDSSTPLHLLQPDYSFNYHIPTINEVQGKMDGILQYLSNSTPPAIINTQTNNVVTDYSKIDRYCELQKGDFRLTSYEWGVTYAGMLKMNEVSNNPQYLKYVTDRLDFLAEVAPYYKELLAETGTIDPLMNKVVNPQALDDAGAMCAAVIKTGRQTGNLKNYQSMIDTYIDYIMYHQQRLFDGTFARNRPQHNSVWTDDMFMSIPALLQKAPYDTDLSFNNEAAKQIKQFTERMWVPEKGLFRHGWVEGENNQPNFFWARANGWALLTLCEALDKLPRSNPEYSNILKLYQQHIQSIVSYQSSNGLWHQLLDKDDSYLETSATAIFVYALAHGINKGWISGTLYGPATLLGWNALNEKITDKGKVEGTCVGTGMGFDAAFYYHRPVSEYAAHGYGPTLLAGAEVIALLKKWHPKMNDSAIHFYRIAQNHDEPIFEIQDPSRPPYMRAGSTRKGKNPVLFIIGDSTVKNGSGKGDRGQWGWGSFFDRFVDTTKISVENHALGGRSSRSFIREGLWQHVLEGLQPGDYLIIQFGHNDGGPLNTGRARASLHSAGEESETVIMQRTGGPETVYSYGHYMRTYIRQAKAHGVNVIALSHTPGNRWTDDKMDRCTDTFAAWTKQVAEEEGVCYIDHNELCAEQYDKIGKEASKPYYKDNVHTSYDGAILHGTTLAKAILDLNGCDLKNYIKPEALTTKGKVAPKPLYRDPVFDGAADPEVVWNEKEQRWFMFYTNRRANMKNTNGVDWVHGTKINIAESLDNGVTWNFRGTANINYGVDEYTYWAPDIVEDNGTFHMFLTIVPGIFSDWQHPRHIVHLTSTNLLDWEFESKINLTSDKVIDAGVIQKPDGTWRMFYNNERDGKTIYYADSPDLYKWEDKGKIIAERGEGPKVFEWKGKYFMVIDTWRGLAIHSSTDLDNWTRQPDHILQKGGSGKDDGVHGQHCDVIVSNDRAYIFYFTHPGRVGDKAKEDNYDTRRTSIQVGELEYNNGVINCNRNKSIEINLAPKK